MRDCYAFNVTVADLVRVTKGPQEADDGQQQVAEAQSHVQQTLKAARAFPWITLEQAGDVWGSCLCKWLVSVPQTPDSVGACKHVGKDAWEALDDKFYEKGTV
eukprot:913824-Pelagomonas_calceolata.AAC.1